MAHVDEQINGGMRKGKEGICFSERTAIEAGTVPVERRASRNDQNEVTARSD